MILTFLPGLFYSLLSLLQLMAQLVLHSSCLTQLILIHTHSSMPVQYLQVLKLLPHRKGKNITHTDRKKGEQNIYRVTRCVRVSE